MDNIKENKITIIIPTYNRKQEVSKLFRCLQKQSIQEFNIVIVDNCSNYNISVVLKEYVAFFGERLLIVKNKTNIGGTINTCKVFDYVNTKWAWLLGDDDFPHEDAIETISKYLEDSVSAIHFSIYNLNFFMKEKTDFKSLGQFIDKYWEMSNGRHEIINLQGDFIFMSNKIYNMERMKKYLPYQYEYEYTRAPHVIGILKMLEDNAGIFRVINGEQLVDISDASNQSWRMTKVGLGLSTFSHIPFDIDKKNRKKLNLIVMFKYTHVLRYRLEGELSKYNCKLIYDSIYKHNLKLHQKVIYVLLSKLNSDGIVARKIVERKNRVSKG